MIDGRLSWHFIPTSFKVFLDVDPDVGAKRIYDASQKGERDDEKAYGSVEEVKQFIADRVASDVRRYQKYYGVDFLDRSNYDLVLDTTNLTIDEKTKIILDRLKNTS